MGAKALLSVDDPGEPSNDPTSVSLWTHSNHTSFFLSGHAGDTAEAMIAWNPEAAGLGGPVQEKEMRDACGKAAGGLPARSAVAGDQAADWAAQQQQQSSPANRRDVKVDRGSID